MFYQTGLIIKRINFKKMNIEYKILVYLIIGCIIFFTMVFLQVKKIVDFDMKLIVMTMLFLNLVAWPIMLLIAFPYYIARQVLDK